MFLRRNRRTVDGQCYEYWTLVRTVRTAKGPRQEIVATLGKEPGLESRSRRGWEAVADLLEGRTPIEQGELGQAWNASPSASWAQVDLNGVRVERVREFGPVYLALALWRRLGLHRLLRELIPTGKEEVPWELTVCLLTVARFCGQRSELEVAERWYADSALEDLLGVSWSQVNEARLYRGLDVLHAHKEPLCAHLLQRYQDWFGVEFEFLLYDVTSTYFEGQARGNAKAARGYSRDHRPDCKQVNIGLVVTPEGLPIGYEVFSGHTADVTTVEEMVEMMETKYGKARRIWVMDRGMVSEENLDFLRERGARYLVGTPKRQLRHFEAHLLDQENWAVVQAGVEVKLVPHPDGGPGEQYVLCRSSARREKEKAMIALARQRLRAQLDQTHASLQKRPARDPGVIERRIGRWLGRYAAAERLIEVKVERNPQGQACGLQITERAERNAWAELAHGAYLLRTNCPERDPVQLWRWYMQLSQAEDAFRISKSDLSLRPVFHQKTARVEAHILVCFLTLAMWRTLELWMRGQGLGNCARQLIKEVATVRSMDVVLPVKERDSEQTRELRLRVVARPDRPVAELLARLGLELPNAPLRVQNVVEKNGV
ncbi:MAG TPA: IS1634 family transposase [Myxococcota bacterium]|nr:IS1634 family transposase [Myxococcota bacterium]